MSDCSNEVQSFWLWHTHIYYLVHSYLMYAVSHKAPYSVSCNFFYIYTHCGVRISTESSKQRINSHSIADETKLWCQRYLYDARMFWLCTGIHMTHGCFDYARKFRWRTDVLIMHGNSDDARMFWLCTEIQMTHGCFDLSMMHRCVDYAQMLRRFTNN